MTSRTGAPFWWFFHISIHRRGRHQMRFTTAIDQPISRLHHAKKVGFRLLDLLHDRIAEIRIDAADQAVEALREPQKANVFNWWGATRAERAQRHRLDELSEDPAFFAGAQHAHAEPVVASGKFDHLVATLDRPADAALVRRTGPKVDQIGVDHTMDVARCGFGRRAAKDCKELGPER